MKLLATNPKRSSGAFPSKAYCWINLRLDLYRGDVSQVLSSVGENGGILHKTKIKCFQNTNAIINAFFSEWVL